MAHLGVKESAVFATRTTSTSSGPVLQEVVAWLRVTIRTSSIFFTGESVFASSCTVVFTNRWKI